MEITFPLEILVPGTPVSQQSRLRKNVEAWKRLVQEACRPDLPEGAWASTAPVAVTLYYLPASPMQGDLDNIIKPILDALSQYVILDDSQVERLVVQRFAADRPPALVQPTERLRQAWESERPVLFVRITEVSTQEPL
jgi:crossover junction endodeoxyribonuclease RusA